MYIHTDELIFDPLPQPYRYVNKLLLQCIEGAIDLAEGGGSAESLHAIVSHNLRLTKVGKLPTQQMETFALSTSISSQEISVYTLLGNTQYLLAGTNQGTVLIYDPIGESTVFTMSITTLSKFAAAHPIQHLIGFETDHSHYVVAFATEDTAYLMFISSAFAVKSTIELDFSLFALESLVLSTSSQPYLIATDGTGRTAIYNCHTPAELIPVDSGTGPAGAKAQASRPIQLEPLLEVERCPIPTGPVTSESHFAQTRTEDPAGRKRAPKKKPAPPPKGKGRAKSPGTSALDIASAADTTNYHGVAYIFDQVVVMRFGTFPILLIFGLQPPNPILNEFPLPSPVSSAVEMNPENHIVFGLENGSFCFLDVARRTIHDHKFPRQGLIRSLLMSEGILYTFAATKAVNAYRIENVQAGEPMFSCSDDDILDTHVLGNVILTLNQKSSDLNILQALANTVTWEERQLQFFPSISVICPTRSLYLGTAAIPINLEVLQTIWNEKYVVFVFNDPVEYRATSPDRANSPNHTKRAPSPKGAKPAPAPKKGKPARSSKKVEDVKEPEPEVTVKLKRQIVGVINLEKVVRGFEEIRERIDLEKAKRKSRCVSPRETQQQPQQQPEVETAG
jgi:hypothetical protein